MIDTEKGSRHSGSTKDTWLLVRLSPIIILKIVGAKQSENVI